MLRKSGNNLRIDGRRSEASSCEIFTFSIFVYTFSYRCCCESKNKKFSRFWLKFIHVTKKHRITALTWKSFKNFSICRIWEIEMFEEVKNWDIWHFPTFAYAFKNVTHFPRCDANGLIKWDYSGIVSTSHDGSSLEQSDQSRNYIHEPETCWP